MAEDKKLKIGEDKLELIMLMQLKPRSNSREAL
jgi:hypothetical protein